MNIQYYELSFGKKIDSKDQEIFRGLYDTEYSIAIKATHYPTIEEAENFAADDIKLYGADGIYSVTPITEEEVYSFYDTENIDNWKILE